MRERNPNKTNGAEKTAKRRTKGKKRKRRAGKPREKSEKKRRPFKQINHKLFTIRIKYVNFFF